MLSRTLTNAVSDQHVCEQLVKKNLVAPKDILGRTESDLCQMLDLYPAVVRALLSKVAAAVAPSATTALSMYQRKTTSAFEYLPTLLPRLDDYLYGGIHASSVTEIVGPAGVGKTQFCHMMCVHATLPFELYGLNGNVLYIDTEGTFSASRLVEIAQQKHGEYFNAEDKLMTLLERVQVSRVSTTTELLNLVLAMDTEVWERKVKLVVLDSIASVVRKEFSRESIMKRQEILTRIAATLKKVAQIAAIPVLVTNQITTVYGTTDSDPGYITPALGTIWAHSVNTRLVLEFYGEAKRRITVAKSPCAPVVSLPYTITAAGIELLQDDNQQDVVLDNPENFWNRRIIPRGRAAPGLRAKSQHHVSMVKQEPSSMYDAEAHTSTYAYAQYSPNAAAMPHHSTSFTTTFSSSSASASASSPSSFAYPKQRGSDSGPLLGLLRDLE